MAPNGLSGRSRHPGKTAVRQRVSTARASRSTTQRAADDHARTDLVLAALGPWPPELVALYCSVPPEPDTTRLVEELARAGVGVLLPVLGPYPDGIPRREPDWALYTGPEHMRAGLWGIPEPTSPSLGARALERAGLVLLPGVAATATGVRLGLGGGWYDRALLHARADAPRWLLLNSDEIVDALPTDPWDQPVTSIVTEQGWVDCHEAVISPPE